MIKTRTQSDHKWPRYQGLEDLEQLLKDSLIVGRNDDTEKGDKMPLKTKFEVCASQMTLNTLPKVKGD